MAPQGVAAHASRTVASADVAPSFQRRGHHDGHPVSRCHSHRSVDGCRLSFHRGRSTATGPLWPSESASPGCRCVLRIGRYRAAASLVPGRRFRSVPKWLSSRGRNLFWTPEERCIPAGSELTPGHSEHGANRCCIAGLSQEGQLPRRASSKGVVGGCHLTGLPSSFGPAYQTSSFARLVVRGISETRLGISRKEP